MPHTIEFNQLAGFFTILLKDPISLRDLEDGIQTLAGDARLAPGTFLLIDLRGCRSVPTAADARSLAWTIAASMGVRRTAILAASMVHFGLANMISTLANLDGGHVQAFQDADKAAAWLKRLE